MPSGAVAARPPRRLAPLAWIFAPLQQRRRALLVLNLVYFGAVVAAAGYARVYPALQRELLEVVSTAFSPSGTLGPLVRAYLEGQLLPAIGLTFAVNLVLGSLATLTLPSAVIPFGGLAVGLYRAALWGIAFSPTEVGPGLSLSAIVALLLLEGEAYVVAMLGVWLWWAPVMARRGCRWRSWREGLRLQARIYPAVALLLAVAAVYEAAMVILVPS